ncbi:Gfo/Idh/MocA family oxidoreductase [Novosphingobium flavum]|uniref:Gfo/Idh/MocA family oxidoreductase n=1 Tax=Novosphingobium flavum TaxID=1778672 RepID=A0A7X1FTJ7_9SPHN|nr:Gfo/Idh/MocA family oxidoreductase [Novosphingobium flavum]
MVEPASFGLVGTGTWAAQVHAPALADCPNVRLVGVYGRDPGRTAAVAEPHGAQAFDDFDRFLDGVDAVAFAVAPQVQSALARRAAEAGKMLLLEKPLATSLAEGCELVATIDRADVAARVFLPGLHSAEVRQLIASARALQPQTATASFNSRALVPGGRFADSPWRSEPFGPLLDVAPHMLAVLVSVLGPVVCAAATRTGKAAFQCSLDHAGGGRSSFSLDLLDETRTGPCELYSFGAADHVLEGGPFQHDWLACYREAVRSLTGGDASAYGQVADVRFGQELVAIVDAACASIATGGSVKRTAPAGKVRRLG